MLQKTIGITSLLFIALFPAQGEWISLKGSASRPAAPVVTLLADDQNSTVLKIELSGFEATDVVCGGRIYKAIHLLTDASTTEAGAPELPCITKVLAIPDRAAVTVEIVESGEEVSFDRFPVPPARPSWKEGDPEPPYVESNRAYSSVDLYPQQRATIDPPGVFRDFRIARLAVYPVRYVAATKELRVATSVTVRLRYGSGDVVNPRTAPRRPIPPSFGAVYRSTIFNYQSILDRECGGIESGRDVMLCITPDNFASSLAPFVEWRHKTGTFVRVTKFSEIGANATNPDIIKNYLAQAYHTWQYPPTYVLLVGDYGYVPIKTVTYDYTIVSEDYFVEIDGNDFFPELMIGRFTHETDAVEQVIVNKIVTYERNPYTANTAWFKKGMVAGNNAYESALITKRFTRDRMMLDGGFTSVDTFMNHSPCYSQLSNLIGSINNGRSFLNYRGEGWSTGWWASCYRFSTTDVPSLNNGRMLTFFTSIGCGVAMFNTSGGNCFGEELLELGTVAQPRGAVTFIGPTSNTHTTYNNKIDMGIYTGMFQEGMETPGQALLRGRLYMYSVFGNERWVEYQTRVYCILGDPSLHVWKNVPRPVTVLHPASIPVGYSQLTITVSDSANGTPVSGAQVCISGDTLYAWGNTNSAGEITIPITPEAVGGVNILARGTSIVPREGTMSIVSTAEHVAPFGLPPIVDTDGNRDGRINPNEHGEITFTLKNWGTQTSTNVRATVTADTSMVEILTASAVDFGDLTPGGSRVGSPFRFFVKPACPVGDTIVLSLHVTSATRSWDYLQSEDVKGCKLKYVMAVVDDRDCASPNGRMDPGETVRLYLNVRNAGEDVAPNVRAVLRCSSPYISVRDSLSAFGTMPADTSIINYGDYFIVRVSTSCPTRYMASYGLLLSTENGRYPYAYVDTFSIPVGMPRRSDPTGPDSYGYFAYASDDTLFQQRPGYSWTEINGIGSQVIASGTDFTSTVTLPFTFRYYGVDYTQVRLSSDGWIAFGSGTQTLAQNYPLPHNDAVNCMVAAFWEDLFATSGETGRLLYFHDAPRRRFIVEWWNVGHRSDVTKKETFQIVLFDPARYPTPTGDGEILIQYYNTADPGGNTVGIENHTQTVGLQYTYNELYDESATPLRDTLAILFTTRTPQLLVSVGDRQTHPVRLPTEFALEQNYPNPFNPSTSIGFKVPSAEFVILKVFDVLGREVATLVNDVKQAGTYAVQWDATNVPSGVYFYRLNAGSFSTTQKLLLLK